MKPFERLSERKRLLFYLSSSFAVENSFFFNAVNGRLDDGTPMGCSVGETWLRAGEIFCTFVRERKGVFYLILGLVDRGYWKWCGAFQEVDEDRLKPGLRLQEDSKHD
jgi:hypothetical protein